MPVTMKQLLESGVHFGHQTRRWNPKMKRYIHGERGGIYIIDLMQTLELLKQTVDIVTNIANRSFVHNNQLTGTIPSDLGKLPALYSL